MERTSWLSPLWTGAYSRFSTRGAVGHGVGSASAKRERAPFPLVLAATAYVNPGGVQVRVYATTRCTTYSYSTRHSPSDPYWPEHLALIVGGHRYANLEALGNWGSREKGVDRAVVRAHPHGLPDGRAFRDSDFETNWLWCGEPARWPVAKNNGPATCRQRGPQDDLTCAADMKDPQTDCPSATALCGPYDGSLSRSWMDIDGDFAAVPYQARDLRAHHR